MRKLSYKKLIIITFIIMSIFYLIACIFQNNAAVVSKIEDNIYRGDGKELASIKDELIVTDISETNTIYPLDKMYKMGEEKAFLFSLSYVKNNLQVGDTLKIMDDPYASDSLYLIFRESYPNISLEEMELESEMEAYQAMQLAIWEVGMRTGEAYYYDELSFIESIREDMGAKNINPRVFQKAKELVRFAENFQETNGEVEVLITLVLDNSNIGLVRFDNDYAVGPYSYKLQAGIFDSANVSLYDKDGNLLESQIVDENGNEIVNPKEEETFFIKIPKNYYEFTMKLEVKAKRLAPRFYTDKYTDYVVNGYEPEELEVEDSFSF